MLTEQHPRQHHQEPALVPVRHISATGSLSVDTPLAQVLPAEDAQVFSQVLKLGTIEDFINYYPRRWEPRGTPVFTLSNLYDGQLVTVWMNVTHCNLRPMPSRPRQKIFTIKGISDMQETFSATFFAGAWAMQKEIHPGDRILLSGQVRYRVSFSGPAHISIEKPEWERQAELLDRPMRTVYPARRDAPADWIEVRNKKILAALEPLPEHLPQWILQRHQYPDYDTAIRALHLPETTHDCDRAVERLTYDEAFATQLAIAVAKGGANQRVARAFPHIPGGLVDQFVTGLPYRLTDGQRDVAQKIMGAVSGNNPLNALVVGDVGSGKTNVAVIPLLQAADNGGQGILIAPTEVLAEQHFNGLSKDFKNLDVRMELMTGSMKTSERKALAMRILNGEVDIVIGTHALLSDKLAFKNLGVVVVDEQHRFGVEQRNKLRSLVPAPHSVTMTATPIPRTMAMTQYGDTEVFTLKGVPAGRKPVQSFVVPTYKPEWVKRIWAVMDEQIRQGRQAFVVGALIEHSKAKKPKKEKNDYGETEAVPALTVYEIAEVIRANLPHVRVGVMHGKLESEEKNAVMASFASGDLDVLVSTTVIEVGVNVPNASIMCIWDADRFGMAQLHQLRGRVGRGAYEGLCLLVTNADEEAKSTERLAQVASTMDGFEIAELDLQARREGNLLSTSQAGKNGLKLLDLSNAERVLTVAREDAMKVVAADPVLRQNPLLKKWLRSMISEDQAKSLLKN